MSTVAPPRRRTMRMRDPLSTPGAMLASIAGGVLLALAFQPLDWWPLAFVAPALMIYALRGRRPWHAAAAAALACASFFLVHIWWITVYLGIVPLIGIVLVMMIWWAIWGVLTTFAWAWGERVLRGSWGRMLVLPVILAALWIARESAASHLPYGGFAWGRLAYSQASSPVGDAVSWVGATGLSMLVATVAAILMQVVMARGVMVRRRVTIAAIAAIGIVAIPAFPVETTGSIRVGAVQGDSEAGLLAPYTQGEIIQQHADATEQLAGEDVDLLVWPENAGEWNPQDSAAASHLLDRVSESVGAPIVLGAVTGSGDAVYNSLLLWQDGGEAAEYHKRNPVPFAEYLPDREFWAPILDALGFLDLIPRDYAIDDSVNAFDVAGTTAGLAICFDIISDSLVHEMVADHGAEIILAPTNNADFGEGSAENVQQLAIAQLRAMEAGRALVNISTVGTSAMVLPDGTMVDRLPQYEAGAMLEDLPLSTTITPAIAAGGWIEAALVALGLAALGALGVGSRRERATPRA